MQEGSQAPYPRPSPGQESAGRRWFLGRAIGRAVVPPGYASAAPRNPRQPHTASPMLSSATRSKARSARQL